jgi:RNA-binding protein YlmH
MLQDRQQLLAHLVNEEERLIGARTLDCAEKCMDQGRPVATDFLDPHARQIAHGVLGSIPSVAVRAFGGYPQAERQRLLIYPEYYLRELLEPPLRAVEVRVNTPADKLKHGDFLGAILSTGINRAQIGDILLVGDGCQVVLSETALPIVLSGLQKVHRLSVQVAEIDLEQLEVAPQRVKEIRTTVASMRLDAVAAFGFGMSRTKMVREIRAERLKVNWRVTADPAQVVAEGDVISMRGRGRVTIAEVSGTTRKGRTALVLQRAF